jgi:hypothetical protein
MTLQNYVFSMQSLVRQLAHQVLLLIPIILLLTLSISFESSCWTTTHQKNGAKLLLAQSLLEK